MFICVKLEMNTHGKKLAKARQELIALMRETEASVCSDITWQEKQFTPKATDADFRSYTQTFTKPERYYSAELWPWYLRGPFCAWLRNWYARRHPEIFGSDYGT